jgi:putative ABC transport system substrate-binding protein
MSLDERSVTPFGRRRFVSASAALLVAPLASAQSSDRRYVVGVLLPFGARDTFRTILRKRLADHGFVEGRNLRVEERTLISYEGAYNATHELMAMKVDAILCAGTQAARGVKSAAASVPVIFFWVHDPVHMGLVATLDRPGGNFTGVSNREEELMQKRLELALEIAPDAKRIAIFAPVGNEVWYSTGVRPPLAERAQRAGVELIEIRSLDGVSAIEEAHQAGAKAMLTAASYVKAGYQTVMQSMIKRSLELKLALVVVDREEAQAGALMSYGADMTAELQRAADMLAKVLEGASPRSLPVDQASRFDFVVNLKTAKALGLTIPGSILLRADKVIE